MALPPAAYNSAMRLGMGFNSYTQSLCVNDIVRKPGNVPAKETDLRCARLTPETDVTDDTSSKQLTDGEPKEEVLTGATGKVVRTFKDGQKEVSQVVTWEASFVENSSDVLQKLDVSGALTIKMAGLGSLSGKAGFVDSTEMKKADINYLVHVKVENQRLIADDVTEFCPIDNVPASQFTDIYGDCFISGFVEGGEFNAIVSITTADTMKKNGITGELELSANISGVDVAGTVKGAKDDNSHLKDAKTKISVNWAGGGDIRDDAIKEWTLTTLKQVAMSFPDAVAACPQRISAILTKYSALRSYHEQTVKGSPLDYENAGVYTASLYDAYTDYKIMWKEIAAMVSKLNTKEIVLYLQDAPPSLKKFADALIAEQKKKEDHYDKAITERKASQTSNALMLRNGRSQEVAPIEKPLPANKVELYDPDVFGLEIAARDCRFEMIKIVREVDAVTKDPKVASDPFRTDQYLSPSIFKLLLPTPYADRLPTMDEWQSTKTDLSNKKSEATKRDTEIETLKKKLEAALITPRSDENGALLSGQAKQVPDLHPSLQTSLSKLSHRADEYRMQNLLKDKSLISTGATFFNHLEDLVLGTRPSELRVWSDDKRIKGLSVVFSGKEFSQGIREGNPQDVLKLAFDEVITELEIYVNKIANDDTHENDANTSPILPISRPISQKVAVTQLAVATSKCNILSAGTKSGGGTTKNFTMTESRQWSFRGFFGFTFAEGFEDLGVIWGQDPPAAAATSAVQKMPAKHLLGLGAALQQEIKEGMAETKAIEHFYLGDCVSTGVTSGPVTSFSVVNSITGTSKIRKLGFSLSAGRLSGLRVNYNDDTEVEHGAYSQDTEIWACEVKAPIVAAKITAAKTVTHTEPFIDSVELVCGDENGEMPLWPLDVQTVRYLGDHTEAEELEVVAKLTEQAPKLNSAAWTLRGFYGEESGGLITRLGLVWGCG